jgi:hypothetical protein
VPLWIGGHVLGLASWILALVAFAGLRDAQGARGPAARVGWSLLLLGAVLQSGVLYGEAFYYPALAGAAPGIAGDGGPLGELPAAFLYLLPNLVVIAGAAGVAFRAAYGLLPATAVRTFALGAIMIALPPFSELLLQVGSVVYAGGLVWLGVALLRSRRASSGGSHSSGSAANGNGTGNAASPAAVQAASTRRPATAAAHEE